MAKKLKYSTVNKILENKVLDTSTSKIVANIRFKHLSQPVKTLSVVSASKNEGKTTIAISLASSFAKAGFRTLLIDADVYQRSISHMLRNENNFSASDVLCGKCSLEHAIVPFQIQNLYFLDCVRSVRSIPELVSTVEFNNMYNIIRDNFDIIIFDTPPVLPCIDGIMISSICDGSIVVVRQYKTKKDEVKQLAEQLDIAKVNVLGSVLNFADKAEYRYYY